jgi:uncharacterized protein YmfQ (DUF2313 family)
VLPPCSTLDKLDNWERLLGLTGGSLVVGMKEIKVCN